MTFQVGDKVKWTSSNTRKVGEVTHIVPAGRTPDDVGKPIAGTTGLPRKEVSYIVRGQKCDYRGNVEKKVANYWPRVSLLEAREG